MAARSLRRSIHPKVEDLEDRVTPAGTVTGSFTDQVWRLTGDNAANSIVVASAGNPGAFTWPANLAPLSAASPIPPA